MSNQNSNQFDFGAHEFHKIHLGAMSLLKQAAYHHCVPQEFEFGDPLPREMYTDAGAWVSDFLQAQRAEIVALQKRVEHLEFFKKKWDEVKELTK